MGKSRPEIRMDILPESENIIFEQRESGITHTPFQLELTLYRAIQRGDTGQVEECIEQYLETGFVVGKLSTSNVRNLKYWAVACVSVAIHYAILGGLDETDAFNLSDIYIRHIDGVTQTEECVDYLREKAVELTQAVAGSHGKQHSPIVRKCLHYIHIHLHEKIVVEDLAKHCSVSREYLSGLFQREVGIPVHKFVVGEKLEESKRLLEKGMPYKAVAYNLGFCSETHYIKCFKNKYGMTPGNYMKNV